MNNFNKNKVNFYKVTEKDENMRLDNLLIKILIGVPKSHIYKIIRSGEIKVNQKKSIVNAKIKFGDIIRIPPIKISEKKPTKNIPIANFPVLFEDDYFLIINKPSGIACHGGSGVSFGIIEQLRKTLPTINFLELAHRLDKETSGILILAKKRSALVGLQEQIRNNQTKKIYLALIIGSWKDKSKNIKEPLYKYLTKDGERRVRIDKENGQFAHTIFSLIQKFEGFSLVKADLKTGKTHQIRVHLQHIGTPIAGDTKYGDFEINKQLFKKGLKRMFLHAAEIIFIHPITKVEIKIKAELPQDLSLFIDNLNTSNNN